MLTDDKTLLVAHPNVPKHMDSERGSQASVEDATQNEFRNHLRDWLAAMTDADGATCVVPEIAATPTKTDSDGARRGTTTTDAPRRPGQVLVAKI